MYVCMFKDKHSGERKFVNFSPKEYFLVLKTVQKLNLFSNFIFQEFVKYLLTFDYVPKGKWKIFLPEYKIISTKGTTKYELHI